MSGVYQLEDFTPEWFAAWRKRAMTPFYLRCENCGRGKWSWTIVATCQGGRAVGPGCLGIMRVSPEGDRNLIETLLGTRKWEAGCLTSA